MPLPSSRFHPSFWRVRKPERLLNSGSQSWVYIRAEILCQPSLNTSIPFLKLMIRFEVCPVASLDHRVQQPPLTHPPPMNTCSHLHPELVCPRSVHLFGGHSSWAGDNPGCRCVSVWAAGINQKSSGLPQIAHQTIAHSFGRETIQTAKM